MTRICPHPSCPFDAAQPEHSVTTVSRGCSVCGKPGYHLVRTIAQGKYTPVSTAKAYCQGCCPHPACSEARG